MAYSKDYRIRAAQYYLSGNHIAKVAEVFGVGIGTISRWKTEFENSGDILIKVQNREHLRKITPEKIEELLRQNPNANQQDMALAFGCTNQSVSDALRKFGFSKKNSQNYTRKPTQ